MENMDSYGPLGRTMRRRRNVSMDGIETQRQPRQTYNHGINWGDRTSKIEPPNPYDQIDSDESAQCCESYEDSLTNQEKVLGPKEKRVTRKFVIGGCEVTVGQLGTSTPLRESQKLTIYLDPNLVDVLKELKKARLISSFSWLVSEALEQYLIGNSI